MIQAITGIGAAFGLAGSAGLNAYIPLLMVALAAHFPLHDPLIKLSEPYDMLGSPWAIAIIAILLVIEMTVDKIPAIDTINDGIQTFIRPAAGAVLFAANSGVVNELHPALALAAGLIIAGGVHAAKGVTRPIVTASTGGTGNWLVSIGEDVMSFFMSLLSLLMPILAMLMVFGIFGLLAYVFVRFRRRKRRGRKVVFKPER